MQSPAETAARAAYTAAAGKPEERAALRALVDTQQAETVPTGGCCAHLSTLRAKLSAHLKPTA
ncbi:hypothetical protein GCM10027048_28090 [Hymenobacter coalescens]